MYNSPPVLNPFPIDTSLPSLKYVIIPDNVTIIDEYSFNNCTALKTLVLPSNITTIPLSSFSNCNALKSITIPMGVTSIGQDAFSFCVAVESIVIPSTITNIGMNSFSVELSNVEYIVYPFSPPTIQLDSFVSINAFTKIYVPDGSVDQYKTSWPVLANYIYPISSRV